MKGRGMQLIVAVDANWGIGYQDELLVRIKADLRRFKAMTTGRCVILGRRTLATFPGGQPLPQRTNVILTRQKDFQAGPALICHTLAELKHELAAFAPEDCMVIGGASVFSLLLPYCQFAYVTKINGTYKADAYFPNLDTLPGWQLIETGPLEQENGVEYQYLVYEQADFISLAADADQIAPDMELPS
jgi:dihydrofolate reductase